MSTADPRVGLVSRALRRPGRTFSARAASGPRGSPGAATRADSRV